MTDTELNERIARLLGWEYQPPSPNPYEAGMGDDWARMCAGGCPLEIVDECPDYLHDWSRFPELQVYVRGLDELDQGMIVAELAGLFEIPDGELVEAIFRTLTDITPEILARAIDAVVGEGDD